ncbi:hypothetical protein ACLOJK_015894 [Asimina triloba]
MTMGRNHTVEIPPQASDDNADLSFSTFRGAGARFPVKRNHHLDNYRSPGDDLGRRRWRPRSHLFRGGGGRKGFQIKGTSLFYAAVVTAVVVFLVAVTVLQSSMTTGPRSGRDGRRSLHGGSMIGSALRFRVGRRFEALGGRIERLRMEGRSGIRRPALAFVLGSMKKDHSSLILLSVVKNLQKLQYVLKVYAVEEGEAHPLWDEIGCKVSVLGPERTSTIDWSIYDGVVLSSLEAKKTISRVELTDEPFHSIPLIWIIQEDTLGKRLQLYKELGSDHLITEWRHTFSRADVVVFPDYSLPMLYSMLDTGNFFVIPGSPVDAWTAEHYLKSHSKSQVRKENGLHEDDLVILVIGASLFYNELPWEYAMAMQAIGPLLTKSVRTKDLNGSLKIIFLCGNSSNGYLDALQPNHELALLHGPFSNALGYQMSCCSRHYKKLGAEIQMPALPYTAITPFPPVVPSISALDISSRLGFPDGSISHYGMDVDMNSVFLMTDIVIYSSFQEEQGFPPLLIRAMSFEVPIVVPDLAIIKRYILDGVHGMVYKAHNPDTLTRVLSVLISDMKLSEFAHVVAGSGKLLARNILASECITGYAKLLESVLPFPSDSLLPSSNSPLQQYNWEWNLFNKATHMRDNSLSRKTSIVYVLEDELISENHLKNTSEFEVDSTIDQLTHVDWDELREIQRSEELESLEMQEIEERMEKPLQSWEEIYRNARKAEKLKFEVYERDEGELERMGQRLCIYEVYSGTGAWPFLHHGSLYRGLSLEKPTETAFPKWSTQTTQRPMCRCPKRSLIGPFATSGRRSKSDDVDAVSRLPILNNTYYRDLLCETGGMFSVAKRIDSIHKIPWIGFQSWRAVGRRVSLSTKAETILEETLQVETKGDTFYYWAQTDLYNKEKNANLSFWSVCDILNGGNCRVAFEKAFRQMYGLPPEMDALPPMPGDGYLWSALYSWAMPTPSFLEFVMFSRILKVGELLVNVWAYHSARKMIYIDPISGVLEERHPVEGRKGLMWVKYFDFALLKSMDEDLAETVDDEDFDPRSRWLWPLTGEVYWQGIYEREREERYRQKMDKKRKYKEKILERHKFGYKQKTLGG